MEKKVVYIKKELLNYKCQMCKRMVLVALAKPAIIETDKSIIHTWDYGHQHNVIIEIMDNGEQFPIQDQTYE